MSDNVLQNTALNANNEAWDDVEADDICVTNAWLCFELYILPNLYHTDAYSAIMRW